MNIVRDLRIKKGIQQKELALELGISSAAVSNWEKGKSDPSGERLRKVADYFGVDEGTILGYGVNKQNQTRLFVPEDPAVCGKSETDQIIERLLEKLSEQPRTPEARLLAKGVDKMQPERRKAFTNMMIDLCPDIFEKGKEEDDT